jgi:hypothetical protein
MAMLHFKSPVYLQRGSGILFHKSPYYIQPGHGYLQKGDGIGAIFSSLLRFLIPAAKKTFQTVTRVGKSFLANPGVKDIVNTVKEEAVRTGINAAANLIAGQPVVEPAQEDIAEARSNIAQAVRKIQPGNGKKRTILDVKSKGNKKKRIVLPEPNIFSAL